MEDGVLGLFPGAGGPCGRWFPGFLAVVLWLVGAFLGSLCLLQTLFLNDKQTKKKKPS